VTSKGNKKQEAHQKMRQRTWTFYDDIVGLHVYTTEYNRLAHRSVYGIPEAKHHNKTASNVKCYLLDKLKVSNAEIHFTCECVNLVTHTNFTAQCVIEADC